MDNVDFSDFHLNLNDWFLCSKVGLKDLGDDDEEDDDDLEDYDYDTNIISENQPNTCLSFDAKSSTHVSSKRYAKVIKYCRNPCGASFQSNDPMCIRTCLCPKTHALKDGTCIPITREMRNVIERNAEKEWIGGMENWSTENRSQRSEGISFSKIQFFIKNSDKTLI